MTTEQQKYLDDCRKRYAADLTDDILGAHIAIVADFAV